MKGLLLAGVTFLFLVAVTCVGLHLYRGRKEYRVFLGAFVAALMLFVVLHRWLPADLGLLPSAAVEPAVGSDFWNGVLILAMLFHGFWVFSYVSCVGPSARIALALLKCRGEGLSFEEILDLYGPEEGLDRILARRLPKLVEGGYIGEVGGGFVALPRGRRYGHVARLLKRAFGPGLGG